MDDLIDRQAAIEAVEHITSSMSVCVNTDECHGMKRMQRRAVIELANLSSAQPKPCEDTISRNDAIRIVDGIDTWQAGWRGDAIESMKALPSAQPERQKGEWIDYTEDGYVECPFCHSATNCDGNKDELHFCFSCGADMRGEQDG